MRTEAVAMEERIWLEEKDDDWRKEKNGRAIRRRVDGWWMEERGVKIREAIDEGKKEEKKYSETKKRGST